ncbi:hypothetical protein QBC33DRAFT_568751 [Phialemonium atrogriseum]|uniref:Cyanovirin-N domain-containing protein n=1 Tax=Phialemonium atrogriseum TaxID=1093897 RepID=A0AAJ0C1I0_9PEZI|nr:uncharacterized protein QBC33DRAFT_568751 [Phialemonium atrogriseum]KAK1768399.1 hypothetical protein QBC33DRAFT_568751 [Phialemonium atrogriseum]
MASIVSTISTTLVLSLAFGGQFVTPQSSCPDGGFITTCIYPGYNFTDSNLGMYCLNNQVDLFAYNWTSLDLNLCVANNGGTLIAWDSGAYADSCSNCSVTKTSTLYLTCDCEDMGGSQIASTLDLNTVIYNVDGAMNCCGNTGSKTWKGPGNDVDIQGLRGTHLP